MSAASLVDRLRPFVDEAVGSLAKTAFRIDPIGGERYSKATSIVSAAYKRHGRILEEAIRTRLSDSPYFTVWHEPSFYVSTVADQALTGRNADIENSLPIELPYLDHGRIIQIDAIVFDKRIGSVRGYEIKRANGDFDAGKKRSILKDLLALQSLLKSYAARQGHSPSIAEARLIAYYGVKPLPAPLSIAGVEMDDHFVFPVFKYVEEVNAYFRERLHDVLRREAGLDVDVDTAILCDRCPMHRQ
jgi:hypothetical protein